MAFSKSIVIENDERIVATGSIVINQYQGEVFGKIGRIMISQGYTAPNELVHRLVSCLEDVGWFNGCSQAVLQGPDFDDDY